jgi:hypothetical protein
VGPGLFAFFYMLPHLSYTWVATLPSAEKLVIMGISPASSFIIVFRSLILHMNLIRRIVAIRVSLEQGFCSITTCQWDCHITDYMRPMTAIILWSLVSAKISRSNKSICFHTLSLAEHWSLYPAPLWLSPTLPICGSIRGQNGSFFIFFEADLTFSWYKFLWLLSLQSFAILDLVHQQSLPRGSVQHVAFLRARNITKPAWEVFQQMEETTP